MESFASVHYKLLHELIPAYYKNLGLCKDLKELRFATRIAFKEVMQAVFPDETPSTQPSKFVVPHEQEVYFNGKGFVNLCEEVGFACKKFD